MIKTIFLILVVCTAITCLKSLPKWPSDFAWSSAGPMRDRHCIQILEAADPHTWNDNFLCWKGRDPQIRWSSAGRIKSMRCTQIHEAAEPAKHTWNDNFLCVPATSPYIFSWSSAGPIPGLACLRWLESADHHTWQDNYLCGYQIM